MNSGEIFSQIFIVTHLSRVWSVEKRYKSLFGNSVFHHSIDLHKMLDERTLSTIRLQRTTQRRMPIWKAARGRKTTTIKNSQEPDMPFYHGGKSAAHPVVRRCCQVTRESRWATVSTSIRDRQYRQHHETMRQTIRRKQQAYEANKQPKMSQQEHKPQPQRKESKLKPQRLPPGKRTRDQTTSPPWQDMPLSIPWRT